MKPSNKVRNLLQCAASGGGYRLLSIIMAVLLFWSTNSQVMAASMPTASSVAPDASDSSTSGDKFNATALLRESAPAAADSQPLTFTQKLEIAGAALLLLGGGGAYAWKAGYLDRFKGGDESSRIDGNVEDRREVSDTSSGKESRSYFSGIKEIPGRVAGYFSSTAEEGEEVASPSRWDSLKAAFAAGGRIGWDFVTLKSCRGDAMPTAEVAKPLFQHLAEVHAAYQNQGWAEQIASRTWAKFGWDLLTLKQYKPEDTRTKAQTQLAEVARLREVPAQTLSHNQTKLVFQHQEREKRFAAITPESSLDEMYDALDPEMQEPVERLLAQYNPNISDSNTELARKFLYFVVKNHDSLNPGMLESLSKAFPMDEDHTHQALWRTLDQEVNAFWDAERIKLEAQPLVDRIKSKQEMVVIAPNEDKLPEVNAATSQIPPKKGGFLGLFSNN